MQLAARANASVFPRIPRCFIVLPNQLVAGTPADAILANAGAATMPA